ncbi:hypothetical protein M8J76_009083 [Diaphorina citri]|nr:hypothetical protein M8J76_009083 [Diaphorina citri]KAI5731861.1 hypothetical protein M8J77_017479 [Diaphorina citri]
MEQVRVYYQNTTGLNSKTDRFSLNLLAEDYDIVCVTESWLQADVASSELFDSRYDVYRQDRDLSISNKATGGGLLVAVKKCITVTPITSWSQNSVSIQTMYLKLSIFNQEVYLVLCYIPPPVKPKTMEDFVLKLCDRDELTDSSLILLGDFNIAEYASQVAGGENTRYSSRMLHLNQIITFYNLEPLNNIKNREDRLLDLCFSNFHKSRVTRRTAPTLTVEKCDGLVDENFRHPAWTLNIELRRYDNPNIIHNNSPNDSTRNFNFKKANIPQLRAELSKINWNILLNVDDVNEALSIFYTTLNNAFSVCIPTYPSKPFTPKFPKWWTRETQLTYKRKERLRKMKNRSSAQQQEYVTLRKKIRKSIKHDYPILIISRRN